MDREKLEQHSLPVPPGENYDAWRIKPLEPVEQTDFRALAKSVFGYAILASSSHNIQPWLGKVDQDGESIVLRVDKSKILPVSDETGRQSFISVGCALANMKVAARHYGLEPQVTYFPQPDDPFLAAKVDLSKRGEVGDEGLFRAITTRAVNRGEYQPQKKVPDKVLEEMMDCVKDSELELHVITNRLARNAIGGLQEMADTIVMNMEKFRRELGPLMLPNDSREFRGMPGSNFGLSGELALELHEQLKGGGRLSPNLARGLPVSDRKGIISSPMLGVICISEASRGLQIKAGQAWQRMALIAESHGVNMSIHAALAEVPISNIGLKRSLRTDFRPIIIFRAGYAKEARSHSPRVPVDRVIDYE